MMVEKPSLVVLSAIGIAIIVLAVAAVYAQSPLPANELSTDQQTRGSRGSEDNISNASKDEPTQNKKIENIIKQKPNRRIFITDDRGQVNITVINADTGRQIWQPISFSGFARESKIVGDELLIISETQSKGRLITEFRKIVLTTGTITSYTQIPGTILNIFE